MHGENQKLTLPNWQL